MHNIQCGDLKCVKSPALGCLQWELVIDLRIKSGAAVHHNPQINHYKLIEHVLSQNQKIQMSTQLKVIIQFFFLEQVYFNKGKEENVKECTITLKLE